jgi:hypothetical protein
MQVLEMVKPKEISSILSWMAIKSIIPPQVVSIVNTYGVFNLSFKKECMLVKGQVLCTVRCGTFVAGGYLYFKTNQL